MRRILVNSFLCLASSAGSLQANSVRVADVRFETDAGRLAVQMTVGWDNAWRHDRNHDSAWVFVQLRGTEDWNRVRGRLTGARQLGDAPVAASFEIPSDGLGVFVSAAEPHRGPVRWALELSLDPSALGDRDPRQFDVDVFALEMVEIPAGGFTLGDPDPAALDFGAFYRSGPDGSPDGLVRVESEEQVIEVGPQVGRLDYRVEQPHYQGDRQGPVPSSFPKGVHRFYVMKYEITQGQYTSFLNSLSSAATYFRAPFGGRDYFRFRGSIRLQDGRYVADHPDRPANFISWDDGTAFADWAGLRPMTEFEFTKACRGPGQPQPREFPWGTASRNRIVRKVLPDDDLVRSGEADESRLNDTNRVVFAASYYWVMDLAGSVWERVVSAGHPAGRAFEGTHGDGRLTPYGWATNADWPKGDDNGGGYGYRGGGHYEHGRDVTEFNPWSPTAYRRFGAWGAAPRSLAYGFRGVRTAP